MTRKPLVLTYELRVLIRPEMMGQLKQLARQRDTSVASLVREQLHKLLTTVGEIS